MKVLFLTNLPSPYMVNFFNELGKLCNLTVVFERNSSSERNGRWDNYEFNTFEGIILKGIPMSPDSALSLKICKYLNNKYEYIIVSNPMTPTGIIAIEYMRLKGIKYIIESEGSFPKNGKGPKEWLKKHIIANAQAYFSTTAKADEYFLTYGANYKKIYHYPFTSLYEKDILAAPMTMEQKEMLRQRYSMRGKRIAVAVGRLIPLKRYDDLIMAWKKVSKEWQLYILGEGEELPHLKKMVKEYNITNIEFLGYKEKEELLCFYRAADLFVHPTSTDVWGLVINEAMACGLPVITTHMCIAGDALIENGINGYLISVGDIETLTKCIESILENEATIFRMSVESIKRVRAYTFENMANVHMQLLNGIK